MIKEANAYLKFKIHPSVMSTSFTLEKDQFGSLGMEQRSGVVTFVAPKASASKEGVLLNSRIVAINDEPVVS